MQEIKIALDWSPNTLHAGFLIAFYKNWYRDAGISITFVNPETNNYHLTPAKMLANDMVHFAIAPSESVLSYRTLPKPVAVKAVAALLQYDTSAIVTLASSGIDEPKKMDGKLYASYQARFEDCIVKKLIRNNGGFGMLKVDYPPKLGIWETLLKNKADATWIFMPWEGVQAQFNNVALNVFRLQDYKIPYGYSPVLMTKESILEEYPQSVEDFLAISQSGFKYAAEHSEDAASFLCKHVDHPNFSNEKMIATSLNLLKDAWVHKDGKWGKMDRDVWQNFMQWLLENKVLCSVDGDVIDDVINNLEDFYTNNFLTK